MSINKKLCPCCGQTINRRVISLYKGMIPPLVRVYKWCITNDRHEFTRKEIKHLLHTDSEMARFGDWVMFGGLMYKPEGRRGIWGMNMERTQMFLGGYHMIPTVIIKDPITKELEKNDYAYIFEIPNLNVFFKDGFFEAEYVK